MSESEKTVFVVQDPGVKNIQPARVFGKIVILLTGHERTNAAWIRLENALIFKPSDYLLLIGNPMFIAMAFHVAANQCQDKPLQVLVWDREHQCYNCEKLDIC